MVKKRVTKIRCPKCRREIVVEDEIELGNYDTVGGIKYIYCPYDGIEIIV